MLYESCGGTGLAQVKLKVKVKFKLKAKLKFKLKFTLTLFLKLFMPGVSLPALCAWLEEHLCLVLLELCVGFWHMRRMRIGLPLLRWSWCRTLRLLQHWLHPLWQRVFAVRNALRHLRHCRSRAMRPVSQRLHACDTSWRRRVCAV